MGASGSRERWCEYRRADLTMRILWPERVKDGSAFKCALELDLHPAGLEPATL